MNKAEIVVEVNAHRRQQTVFQVERVAVILKGVVGQVGHIAHLAAVGVRNAGARKVVDIRRRIAHMIRAETQKSQKLHIEPAGQETVFLQLLRRGGHPSRTCGMTDIGLYALHLFVACEEYVFYLKLVEPGVLELKLPGAVHFAEAVVVAPDGQTVHVGRLHRVVVGRMFAANHDCRIHLCFREIMLVEQTPFMSAVRLGAVPCVVVASLRLDGHHIDGATQPVAAKLRRHDTFVYLNPVDKLQWDVVDIERAVGRVQRMTV